MIQEVEIDTKKIFLDSDRKYTGKENPDDEEKLVKSGESIFVEAGKKHRLENPGSRRMK